MTWKVYNIPPIDIGWEHLKSVKETICDMVRLSSLYDSEKDLDSKELLGFIKAWEAAKELAGVSGWEGDFREDPKVFWLPGDVEFRYAFAFKQDNNGTTFVVSPQELPALERLI